MSLFLSEIRQQPETLNAVIRYYMQSEGGKLLDALQPQDNILLTGMGASYHAAWITSLHFQHLGRTARSLEATDLLYYSHTGPNPGEPVIYISQSGSSAEVPPVLEKLRDTSLLAVTNEAQSPLALRARQIFPLLAGREKLIASKSYINTLILLWLIARRLAGVQEEGEISLLIDVSERVRLLIKDGESSAAVLSEGLRSVERLVFIGHGPHAATARQAAMIMGEWAKLPVMSFSAGGLRHGFIEALSPGTAAVLFASPGASFQSILALGDELDSYGIKVICISNGAVFQIGETPVQNIEVDEFLSPILDILPVQFFANRLANELEIPPGFLRIQKVIKKL